MPIEVVVELGKRRAFAAALDWPGWCRGGKDEAAALDALTAMAPRYAPVAKEAGVAFPSTIDLDVVARVPGTATTEFGAPDAKAPADSEPLTKAQAERLSSLVEAAWTVLDRVAAHAPPELRKGPRGGGRGRDEVVRHVVAAEAMYARKLGIREKEPDPKDKKAVSALRAQILDALRSARDGEPPVEKGWPPRYAARRIAWHALDHAWEIEDRSEA